MAGLPEQDIPVATNPQEPDTLGTVIVRDRAGTNDIEVVVENGHPLPDTRSVLVHMPPKVERYIKKEHKYGMPTLRGAIQITRSIATYQQWSDAIGAAILTRMSNKTEAVTDLKNISEGGYLAIGQTLFKLSPVAMVKTSKALAATRRKVLDKVNTEASLVISSAKATSDALLSSASRKKLEADEYKAVIERGVNLKPPSFMIDYALPIKYAHGSWQVGFTCSIVFSSFEFSYVGNAGREIKHVWQALPMQPRPILMWIPVTPNGIFSATSVCVDDSFPILPHMDHYSGCLGLSGLPSVINGRASVRALKGAIEQCFKVVNLSSLYVSPDGWKETFKEAIPLTLFSAFGNREWINSVKALAISEGVQEEHNTPTPTWEAPERTPEQEAEALAELDAVDSEPEEDTAHHQVAPEPEPEPEPIGEGEWTVLNLSSDPPSQ